MQLFARGCSCSLMQLFAAPGGRKRVPGRRWLIRTGAVAQGRCSCSKNLGRVRRPGLSPPRYLACAFSSNQPPPTDRAAIRVNYAHGPAPAGPFGGRGGRGRCALHEAGVTGGVCGPTARRLLGCQTSCSCRSPATAASFPWADCQLPPGTAGLKWAPHLWRPALIHMNPLGLHTVPHHAHSHTRGAPMATMPNAAGGLLIWLA